MGREADGGIWREAVGGAHRSDGGQVGPVGPATMTGRAWGDNGGESAMWNKNDEEGEEWQEKARPATMTGRAGRRGRRMVSEENMCAQARLATMTGRASAMMSREGETRAGPATMTGRAHLGIGR